MKKHSQSGFTLYELMITLLVIGVILSLGVPNLQEFNQNGRVTATANDLHSTLQYSRSEAARARQNVTICASNNSGDALAGCAGTFDDGWIVFEDVDGDIVRDAGETVLRRFPAIENTLDITTNGGATYFSFGPNGLGRGDVAGVSLTTARICDSRGNITGAGGRSTARALVITPIGRAWVIWDVAQITAQGDCP